MTYDNGGHEPTKGQVSDYELNSRRDVTDEVRARDQVHSESAGRDQVKEYDLKKIIEALEASPVDGGSITELETQPAAGFSIPKQIPIFTFSTIIRRDGKSRSLSINIILFLIISLAAIEFLLPGLDIGKMVKNLVEIITASDTSPDTKYPSDGIIIDAGV